LKIAILSYRQTATACFSEEDFSLHVAAVRAFKFVNRKVAARWMLLDNRKLYRLAARRAGIIREKVKEAFCS
jgi:hypothetical protein